MFYTLVSHLVGLEPIGHVGDSVVQALPEFPRCQAERCLDRRRDLPLNSLFVLIAELNPKVIRIGKRHYIGLKRELGPKIGGIEQPQLLSDLYDSWIVFEPEQSSKPKFCGPNQIFEAQHEGIDGLVKPR